MGKMGEGDTIMVQFDAQDKEWLSYGIEALDRDIKNAISQSHNGRIPENKLKIFNSRVKMLESNLHAFQNKLIETSATEVKEWIRQLTLKAKHIIFWDLIVLFFVWAEVDIKTGVSGGLLGVTVSGIDRIDLYILFLVLLSILHMLLFWRMIKYLIIMAQFFRCCRIKRKYIYRIVILLKIKSTRMVWDFCSAVFESIRNSSVGVTPRQESLALYECGLMVVGSFVFSMLTFAMLYISIENEFFNKNVSYFELQYFLSNTEMLYELPVYFGLHCIVLFMIPSFVALYYFVISFMWEKERNK